MLRWSVHLQGAPKVYDDAPVAVGGASVYSFGGSSPCSPGGGVGGGGWDQIHVNVFNVVTLLWTRLPAVTDRRGRRPRRVPSWRYGHTAVLVEERGVVVVFGGVTYIEDFCKNRPYAFNVETHRWLRLSVGGISGTAPTARSGHSAAAVGGVMYVYGGDTWSSGGAGADAQPSDDRDVYKLDTAGTMAWSVVRGGARGAGGGVASAWHSATVIGTRMFVFGGEGSGAGDGREAESGEAGDAYNYVRVFDTETDAWLAPPPGASPSAGLLPHQGRRKYHSAFAHQGELYVLGGGGGRSKRAKKRRRRLSLSRRTLWRFDARTFSWSRVRVRGEGPVNTWMCCCPLEWGRVVLFGGFRGYARQDDLYVLDLDPSLKTLSKLAVVGHGLERSEELPRDLRWELEAMTGNHPHMTGNHPHGGGGASRAKRNRRKGRRRKRKR